MAGKLQVALIALNPRTSSNNVDAKHALILPVCGAMRVDLCIRRPRDGPAAAAAAGSTDRPCSNLFARLDDDTARRFHALACEEMSELDLIQRPSTKKRNRWVVSHESCSTRVESGVEFLPLRIQVRSTSGDQTQSDGGDSASAEGVVNIVYASYNGGCVHRAGK